MNKNIKVLLEELKNATMVGNYSRVQILCDEILKLEPLHQEAILWKKKSNKIMEQIYVNKLGSFNSIPHKIISDNDLMWVKLTDQEKKILSLINEQKTIQEIIDSMEQQKNDVLYTLIMLLEKNVIKCK